MKPACPARLAFPSESLEQFWHLAAETLRGSAVKKESSLAVSADSVLINFAILLRAAAAFAACYRTFKERGKQGANSLLSKKLFITSPFPSSVATHT